MKADLLYYQRFVKDLESIGFKINLLYDPCIANIKLSKENNSLLSSMLTI